MKTFLKTVTWSNIKHHWKVAPLWVKTLDIVCWCSLFLALITYF